MMKKLTLLSACMISAALMLNAHAANKQPLDEIVAVVNDDVITNTELGQALNTIKMQLAQEQQSAIPHDQVLHKQVLDQLVNKKLQLQFAKQAGIKVSEADLNNAIERIASQNHISVKDLYSRLNQEGMTEKNYRKEIQDQMTMQKLQQQEVVSHIAVSPQEIDTFIRSQGWQNNDSKQYHIEDIIVPLSDKPSSNEINQAKDYANVLMTKLNTGKDFTQALQDSHVGKSPIRHSDLGWRKLAEIPSAFADHVIHLDPKHVAGPIQTENGVHVIRLVATRAGDAQQAPNRKQAEQVLLQRKFEDAMQHWVSKLRSQAFITTTDNDYA